MQNSEGFSRLEKESGAFAQNVTAAVAQLLGAATGDPAGSIADGLARVNVELSKMTASKDFETLKDAIVGTAQAVAFLLRITKWSVQNSGGAFLINNIGESAANGKAAKAAMGGSAPLSGQLTAAARSMSADSLMGKMEQSSFANAGAIVATMERVANATETLVKQVTGRQ